MSDTKANAGPPPSVDIQDPLPEGTFLWRRVFSYGVSAALLALIALVVWRMESASELKQVALYLCLLLFMVVTYYMIAPSAEQVIKMIQTAKMLIHGVTVHNKASASDDPDGHRQAETSTTVGRPAPAPEIEEDAAPRGRS